MQKKKRKWRRRRSARLRSSCAGQASAYSACTVSASCASTSWTVAVATVTGVSSAALTAVARLRHDPEQVGPVEQHHGYAGCERRQRTDDGGGCTTPLATKAQSTLVQLSGAVSTAVYPMV